MRSSSGFVFMDGSLQLANGLSTKKEEKGVSTLNNIPYGPIMHLITIIECPCCK